VHLRVGRDLKQARLGRRQREAPAGGPAEDRHQVSAGEAAARDEAHAVGVGGAGHERL